MKQTIAVFTALGVLAGCGKSNEAKIQVGVIISTTGNYGALGPERVQGVALAVDQINSAGGVLGKQLEILPRDDGTVPGNAKDIATDLVTQLHVPAIIGASASGSTLAVSDITIPNHVVQISGSSTSPAITTLPDDGYVNRTCPSDALQGKLLAQRARNIGKFSRVAIMHDQNNAYSEGLANAFEAAFSALGGQVTLKLAVAPSQTSYKSELDQVYNSNPEAILLPTYTGEAVQIIKDYVNSYSNHNTFWYFADSLAEQDFVTLVGSQNFTFQHEGTAPSAPAGATYDNFASAYNTKYGNSPVSTSFTANFYDATYLLALAMEAAGSTNGELVKAQLQAVSAGGASYAAADYKAAVAAIHAGTDVDYNGASGNVDLDANGEPVAPYDIWQVQSGQITVTEHSLNPSP